MCYGTIVPCVIPHTHQQTHRHTYTHTSPTQHQHHVQGTGHAVEGWGWDSRVPGMVVLGQPELGRQVVGDLLQGLATRLGHAEVVEENGPLPQ